MHQSRDSLPIAVLVASVGAISAFYHDSTDISDPHQRMVASFRLIGKMPTLAAMAYNYSLGKPFIYPKNELDYASNFLRMCFAVPARRRIVIFSGGAAVFDDDKLLDEIRSIQAGGGFGSIIGRNSFQRRKEEALRMLGAVMEIYGSPASPAQTH
jgi:hypothetical protein